MSESAVAVGLRLAVPNGLGPDADCSRPKVVRAQAAERPGTAVERSAPRAGADNNHANDWHGDETHDRNIGPCEPRLFREK